MNTTALVNKIYKNSERRFKKFLSITNLDAVNSTEKLELTKILQQHQTIFHLEQEQLTANNFYKQHIDLQDKTPVYTKNDRLSHTQGNEMNNQVNELLQNKIIEPSVSLYNSPLLLVLKKENNNTKQWRLVVDYRKINEVNEL